MITIMLSGTLAKQPETRTSKNGNSYTLASIRVQTSEGDLFASVTAFGDLCSTLAGLAKGDPVTVIGTGKVTTYQGKDGATKARLSITASRIITIADHQAPTKERKPRGDGQSRRSGSAGARPDEREFDDDLQF